MGLLSDQTRGEKEMNGLLLSYNALYINGLLSEVLLHAIDLQVSFGLREDHYYREDHYVWLNWMKGLLSYKWTDYCIHFACSSRGHPWSSWARRTSLESHLLAPKSSFLITVHHFNAQSIILGPKSHRWSGPGSASCASLIEEEWLHFMLKNGFIFVYLKTDLDQLVATNHHFQGKNLHFSIEESSVLCKTDINLRRVTRHADLLLKIRPKINQHLINIDQNSNRNSIEYPS